ncbi:hypothetical protein [Paenarthrobacter ureafaciens]|uniref:hypothetical protein n=1 Tax=Paenarthrobacter ureafaciens TaxID=37931 RepID=UPI001C2C1A02|nr:hypothetical protein [Paenarthrobacter ureafaciens]UOD81981.1 hypothetical protein MQZ73_03585 [Paenarthrobacter ureafaciens]WNZ05473.1 hypothetical protein PVT25_08125 [Paenarthrobacter ureafaciens]
MPRNATESIRNLSQQVATVVNAGGTTTKDYDRILERWTDYTNQQHGARAQLKAAILGDATPERIAELNALALAELATPVGEATIRNDMAAAVYPELAAESAKVAAANYETLRARFNTTAEEFTTAYNAVNPETDPAQLIKADNKTRTAWATAGVIAMDLTAQMAPLAQAAELAGITVTGNDTHLSLTVDAEGLHRRRVWEAWETTGRTNQWAAILDAGATIHAPALEDHKPYRRPAPIELRMVPANLGYRQIEVDPEDEKYSNTLSTNELEKHLSKDF